MEDRLYNVIHEEPYNHLECEAFLKKADPALFARLEQETACAPYDFVREYGLDCIYAYIKQEGAGSSFNEDAIYGIFRFLGRIWRLFRGRDTWEKEENCSPLFRARAAKALRGLESRHMHVYTGALVSMAALLQKEGFTEKEKTVFLSILEKSAPCLAGCLLASGEERENLRDLLSGSPVMAELAVQMEGRTRTRILLPEDSPKEKAEETAAGALRSLGCETEGLEVLYVPGRIINFFSRQP